MLDRPSVNNDKRQVFSNSNLDKIFYSTFYRIEQTTIEDVRLMFYNSFTIFTNTEK